MKAKYINPFIKASKKVLEKTMGLEPKMGSPYVKSTPFPLKEVILVIGITGQVKGQIVIGMQQETAKKVASKMMMGMEVPELNEMAKSALSELGNMILGNTATLIANEGVEIDITPPTLMVGKDISLSFSDSKTLGLDLSTEFGDFVFDINLKEVD
ncbi:MAG: chemotaxis protein CheX [Bacillota bacterium]